VTSTVTPSLLGAHSSAAWASSAGLPGVPGPLTATWRHLGQSLAPLLHPASSAVELSVALLLWGPRGSGRRTAARAAAAALGLNYIELSCHDLKVGRLRCLLCCFGEPLGARGGGEVAGPKRGGWGGEPGHPRREGGGG
jgi:hypothetical protein